MHIRPSVGSTPAICAIVACVVCVVVLFIWLIEDNTLTVFFYSFFMVRVERMLPSARCTVCSGATLTTVVQLEQQ